MEGRDFQTHGASQRRDPRAVVHTFSSECVPLVQRRSSAALYGGHGLDILENFSKPPGPARSRSRHPALRRPKVRRHRQPSVDEQVGLTDRGAIPLLCPLLRRLQRHWNGLPHERVLHPRARPRIPGSVGSQKGREHRLVLPNTCESRLQRRPGLGLRRHWGQWICYLLAPGS